MEESRLLESEGFQVFKTIGRGSFGSVFLVHHPQVGVVVAKVVNNDDFKLNEWKVAGILEDIRQEICPFIVRSILEKTFEKVTIILMEYANLGVLYGLFYIHSKGIVHRDIKPGNIMLHSPLGSGRLIAKIGDFGEIKIKKQIDNLTLMTQRGTVPYMPPELFLAPDIQKVLCNQKVDIWSLGITFYQIVTHKFPFQSLSETDIKRFMGKYKQTGILEQPDCIKDKNLWGLLTSININNEEEVELAIQSGVGKN
ncbi:MAG: hypothetical protein EZS28_013177 [Streblomastix strix]|uniref:non-specific serine/threonine protein kinase n=1 Tax=Streblomastix strix TaxID=222440 RepID=A0A5J4W8P9_9EUKA|nr:MAG: hypothetical protein EZS28_013177 [Streblomastix strix]